MCDHAEGHAEFLHLVPLLDVVVHVIVPVAAAHAGFDHGLVRRTCRGFIGEEQVEEGGAVAGIVALLAEGKAGDPAQPLLDDRLVLALLADDVGQLSRLRQADGRVDLADAVVGAHDRVWLHAPVVALVAVAVVAEVLSGLDQLLVVGDDDAAFSASVDLEEVEAEAAHLAEEAKVLALVRGAERLSGVLDEHDALLLAHGHDAVQIGRCPAHVDEQHRFRLRCDRCAYPFGAQAQGLIDLREHGQGAREEHGLDGGHEGEGRHDHVIAISHAAGCEHRANRRAAAAHRQRVLRSSELGDLGLEILRLPMALALRIVVVAEEHARIQDIHHFLLLLLAEQFGAWHVVRYWTAKVAVTGPAIYFDQRHGVDAPTT